MPVTEHDKFVAHGILLTDVSPTSVTDRVERLGATDS